jgi:hypothetical protein
MATVNDNYPNKNFEMSDDDLKSLAIQNYNQQEVKNTGFPTEVIKLPSKGLVYPEGSALRSGEVEMKYMTAREEDILTSQNLIKQGVVVDKLMQSMIVTPVNFNDIVIGDKNALMIAARILGYGKEYPIEVSCPSCKASNKITADLTQLPEQHIPDNVVMPAPGLFEFILPQSKRIIHFKLMTTGIDRTISKELEANKRSSKNGGVDRELTTRLKHLIVSVDGNADKRYIHNFVDNELFAIDSKALRGYIRDIAPDAKFEIDFSCTECGHEQEALGFTIDASFFWPR